jgi:hypothetical protein
MWTFYDLPTYGHAVQPALVRTLADAQPIATIRIPDDPDDPDLPNTLS